MIIIQNTILREELKSIAQHLFGDIVKPVVDIENEEIRKRIIDIITKRIS